MLLAACAPPGVALDAGAPPPRGGAPLAPLALPAAAGDQAAAVMHIEDIVYERDGDGDPRGLRIRVQPDGLIEHTRTGHPRRGTVDEMHTAQLAPQHHAELVELLHRQGFFALQAVYDDAQSADGAWALVRVVQRGDGAPTAHQVWWREGHAPAALQPVEAALRALGGRAAARTAPR